jgi:hypothetical protein
MQNNSWFQVDTNYLKNDEQFWQTCIFAELSSALNFVNNLKENLWTVLHIYSRKLLTNRTLRFHEIVEKVVVCDDGKYVLFTQAGLIFYENSEDDGIRESFIPGKEIFEYSDYFPATP